MQCSRSGNEIRDKRSKQVARAILLTISCWRQCYGKLENMGNSTSVFYACHRYLIRRVKILGRRINGKKVKCMLIAYPHMWSCLFYFLHNMFRGDDLSTYVWVALLLWVADMYYYYFVIISATSLLFFLFLIHFFPLSFQSLLLAPAGNALLYPEAKEKKLTVLSL